MGIGAETIEGLEKMTKIHLSDAEQNIVKEYLSNLTKQFDHMENVPTSETEPLISVSSLKNILREDVSSQMVTRDELFENAVEENNGYFQVPKTIE